MKISKRAFYMITILSAFLGVLGITVLFISYKVTSWVKNIEQIKLGYLDIFNEHTITINIFAICSITLCIFTTFILLRIIRSNTRKLIAVFSLISSILIGTYLILCLFFYQNLDELIEMNHLIYQPKKIDQSTAEKIRILYSDAEEIKINTTDNINLYGWLIKKSSVKEAPLLIYFGGSGEEVSDMLSIAEGLDGWSVALINYRSYGLSEGKPSMISLYNDANSIYDYFSKRSDIDNKKIVSMGYSLGTGIAVNLSSERSTVGTILVSPYDNYSKLKGKTISNALQLHNMFPLSYFIGESYNSIKKASSIKTPLLCLAGDLDKNIPIEYSNNLVAKWGGEKTMKTIHRGDHSFIFMSGAAWNEIKNFLKIV
ncbi:alpha/beta hydrolase [Paenibacillus qinlingensis]|uniref:alpha/beta hydrolase n=1 Tax=Paenibacillus qinlingensis TaxID=1837343 RepID=UPI00156705EE|nr:dienelactone hydrolase family protein [Paenibacillus qinlingensis]NQX62723.1 dienelactone hydrolase family protein [Paenibacillus qinlingensis]